MSIAAVGSGSNDQVSTVYANYQQRMKAFKALSSAMQSGDLADAQKALATFQQYTPGDAQNATGQNSTISTDFANMANALNSNDMAGAQKAFGTLQQDMQKIHGHHHHGHRGGGETQTSGATQVTDSTESTSTASEAAGSLVNILA